MTARLRFQEDSLRDPPQEAVYVADLYFLDPSRRALWHFIGKTVRLAAGVQTKIGTEPSPKDHIFLARLIQIRMQPLQELAKC